MQTSFPGFDHVEAAIKLLQMFEPTALQWQPKHGYWLAFSGGKDSCVILDLAKRSGVKFKAFYNVTTIDPPELVRFIRKEHPEVTFNRQQKMGMAEMMATQKGLPSRIIRWCCEEYKHTAGSDWVNILGVRQAESVARKALWRSVMPATKQNGPAVNPIVAWSDSDVWDYIHDRKLPYCKLYDEGFKRLGCIGCPIAGEHRRMEFERWPKMELVWRSAAKRYWVKYHGTKTEEGKDRYCSRFKSGDEFFEWWLSANPNPREIGQCEFGMA